MCPNPQSPRIWSHSLKKSLIENFLFCAVSKVHLIKIFGKKGTFCFKMRRVAIIGRYSPQFKVKSALFTKVLIKKDKKA